MPYDVSATGLTVLVRASVTFPAGFIVSAFADDADPFDIPDIEIATAAMGLNGDLITFSSPVPITPTLNVIPGSPEDQNLSILYNANRAARGRRVARDIITMIVTYPDGSTTTLSQGKLTSGNPGKSIASAGRVKTKAYTFAFQDVSVTPALI